jgi:hypothetical protein
MLCRLSLQLNSIRCGTGMKGIVRRQYGLYGKRGILAAASGELRLIGVTMIQAARVSREPANSISG